MKRLNHLDYFRLPWNLADNSISWLEPTVKCNLTCDGCYRKNENKHKSLDQIKEELKVFRNLRKVDGFSIAGGEPLLHPDIVEIVRLIKEGGDKPIINTNGLALTKELLMELKKAGVFGFTFHIDSKQGRPGWKDADEIKLNELRYKYATMLKEAKDIACSFNSTVYEDTIHHIPAMVKWANDNIDRVQTMVFIIYRAVKNDKFDYFDGPNIISTEKLVYNEEVEERTDIIADEVVELIRTAEPDFDPCGYLNGTNDPSYFKWLLTVKVASKNKVYGYMGHKGIEMVQNIHHLLFDKYLAYTLPKWAAKGKSMLLMGVLDKKLRKTFFKFFKNPFRIFTKLYNQSILIIQPVDVLEDGRQNMCDGCPDITVWNGKLVWSCRMEEQENFGRNFNTYPKGIFEVSKN